MPDLMGRVAKLQLKFAVAAREENRYHALDEREVASFLRGSLKDCHSLPEETATEVADKYVGSSSLERYLDCTGRGLRGVGWGGDGNFGIVKNSPASPISPSTPMCAVYVGLAAEKGKNLLARPPQPYREMGRR